jgi:hypothetical protein
MNPDKLFDYLDGKLPEWERADLEKRLADDPQLQKEFSAARRIHSNMRGESREVVLDEDPAATERGRRMALRVGSAFVVLIAVNVGIGLWFIAHHEASNPNRKLLDDQMRDQLTKSLQQAAHGQLTPPPLDVSEITVSAPHEQLNEMADKVVALAQHLGGSATKELPDANQAGVLVDVPSSKENEFRNGLTTLNGAPAASPASIVSANETPGGSPADKKSFIIHIVETPAH